MAVSVSEFPNFELAAYAIPSITVYNRLESNPRNADFERSLKAEVRDPLWMLTRQWQFGEFKGEDAATALTTKILGEHTTINTVHLPDDVSFPYDSKMPLETIVERETLLPNLFLAIQAARYFIKLIKFKPGFSNLFTDLLEEYPLDFAFEENDDEGKQLLYTVSGKVFDGFKFHKAIMNNSVQPSISSGHETEINDFRDWYHRQYSQPDTTSNSAWLPSRLEYEFAVSSTSGQAETKKLSADHYAGGHLDWYSFDLKSNNQRTSALVAEHIQSYIPTPLTFRGLPLPRFWMMEESVTDFGKIETTPTGLLHLLLAEFGLTCSNDWFMLPYQLPINTFCEIKGILVKDVFGEYTIIRPAGKSVDSNWQTWAMFNHTNKTGRTSETTNSFYLVPAVTKLLEGPRLEQVNFLRDEMANMVWAVENVVPSQAGRGVSGDEMAIKRDDGTGPPTETNSPDTNTLIRYVLGTTVPANWIPFIPAQIKEGSPEIRLQRAKLPGAKSALGAILTEMNAPYYIDEEILGSSGLLVSRTPQLARFLNGVSPLWIGRRKEAGMGEGWSNLKFDQIVNIGE